MKPLILFGGSFNPFHLGHKSLVQFVLKQFPDNKLLIIPNLIPPHKSSLEVAPEHRIKMIQASLHDLSGWDIETYEIRKKKPSYTVETLDYLEEQGLFKYKPFLMIGDDWVPNFHQWRDAEIIAERVQLLVFKRTSPRVLPFDFPHQYLDNPIIRVSSTDIRKNAASGLSLEPLVGKPVAEYIKDHELYQD